jgi:plastocyanin
MARFVRSGVAAALLVCLPVALVACSSSKGSAKSADGCRAISGKTTLVARDVAWDVKCLTAKPGTVDFTIINKDSGVQHNLRVTGQGVNAHTKLQDGPVTQKLSVDLTRTGRYSFVCDIHPNMEGTLTVK